MSVITSTFALSLFAATALAIPPETPRIELQAERGLGDKSYAPWQVDCPTNVTWIRNATVSFNISLTKKVERCLWTSPIRVV